MLELFKRLGFVPRRCTWEITLECNLRCGHCGSRAGEARPDELTTDEAFVVIDDLVALGCRDVTLAGGEPTLRADWPLLVERLARQGVKVALISNGLTWSAELTDKAKAAGIHRMGFSLDGLERTHTCVRKAEDGHRKVLDAMDLCVAAQIRVVAVTHITKRSLPELEAIHALLAHHGVSTWQIQLGAPLGNMAEDRSMVLGPEDIVSLLPRVVSLRKTGRAPRVVAADNVGYFGDIEEELRDSRAQIRFWVGCRAGLEVMGIESNGDVKGCLSLPSGLNGRCDFVEGNLRKQRLSAIWNNPNAFSYNRKFRIDDLRGACAGCEFGEVCRGGCTFTSIAHSGHPHDYPHCYYRITSPASQSAPGS
jgi:radical SAM protein with 4Fe4S-binding SPASM domain